MNRYSKIRLFWGFSENQISKLSAIRVKIWVWNNSFTHIHTHAHTHTRTFFTDGWLWGFWTKVWRYPKTCSSVCANCKLFFKLSFVIRFMNDLKSNICFKHPSWDRNALFIPPYLIWNKLPAPHSELENVSQNRAFTLDHELLVGESPAL